MGMRCEIQGSDMKLSGALLKAVSNLDLYDGDCVFTLHRKDLAEVISEMAQICDSTKIIEDGIVSPRALLGDLYKLDALIMEFNFGESDLIFA